MGDVQLEKVAFKKNKSLRPRGSRQRGGDDEPDTNDDNIQSEKLEELKEIQKIKKRPNKGINVADLLVPSTSKKVENTGPQEDKGGLKSLNEARTLTSELDLGHTFSVETNRRDEDADMMKFIEQELGKRKGAEVEETVQKPMASTSEDLVFSTLPQHLLFSNKKKNEEMLSNQMLSGIPEVDLGVDERIRNIEATEEAKNKLLDSKRRRHHGEAATLVPTNVAVNFVQHNRYKVSENETALATAPKKPRIAKPVVTIVEEPVVVIGDEPRQGKFKNYPSKTQGYVKHPGKEKATDDYHFERFRKQFRK